MDLENQLLFKMNKITKYTKRILPFLFGLAVFMFFSFSYGFHLHYQEQLEMFLFTSDYFNNLTSLPGGFADYIGTFFTQFYYFSWLGALIIATMLILLQQQVAFFTNKLKQDSIFYPLTFIPSFLFWALLCDENFLLTALIAVILTLAFAQFYSLQKNKGIRISCFIVMLFTLYWLAGGVFWIFGVLCLILEYFYFKQLSKIQWIILIISFLLIVVGSPLIAKQFLQYPLSRLWWGITYYRYPVVSPYPLLAVWVSIFLIPLFLKYISVSLNATIEIVIISVQVILIVIFGSKLITSTADWSKEEIMSYDYSVRNQDWNKVISMANHKDPKTPLSVACLNLALSKTGTMGDCMFRYFQNGTEGLLPTFQRDFTLPLIVGEIYYHLGFLNTSMRYAFEAMEAIPDYKKSSRAMKRIAEVNLLNGEYKVAAKYLHLLQHTLFYRNWANETLECIGNEKKINQNPEWAILKKYQFTEDFLFSEQEKDQMLGLLFAHCKSNRMAYDYLIAYTLLTKDLNHFIQYFPLGKDLGYKEIPAHYQEALIFMWANKTSQLNQTPWPINDAVKQSFARYAKIFSADQKMVSTSADEFSQTYWYYLQFRK